MNFSKESMTKRPASIKPKKREKPQKKIVQLYKTRFENSMNDFLEDIDEEDIIDIKYIENEVSGSFLLIYREVKEDSK